MSVMDKFLNAMRLNSDEEEDDYFDDEYYDEEDDEEYEAPRRTFHRERPAKKEEVPQESRFTVAKESKTASRQTQSAGKVTPMRPSRKSQGGQSAMEVCVIKPTSVEDAREITETLLASRTVVLNLEGLDLEVAQRIIDFTSGACFAVNGNLQKVSNYIFIVTPSNVDISGDFQNIMSAFEASSLQSDI